MSTENGEFSNVTAREAITILHDEMEGFYKNAQGEEYSLDVKGPDFRVKELGDFQNITHVEIKNPVGSAIKIANGQTGSITKQGKKIGAKIVYQQNFWSDPNKISAIENLNPTALLSESTSSVLEVVYTFDIPAIEKALMETSILRGSRNCNIFK